MMDDILSTNFTAKRQRLPKRTQLRNRLAKRSAARQEKSLLPLIDMATTYVCSGISNDLLAAYKDPETRRREREIHIERQKLLNIELPRLMQRIEKKRQQRIMTEARHISFVVYHYLKIQMKRSRGIRLLMNRANHARLHYYFPRWQIGFKTRKLITTIDRILYRPVLYNVFKSWNRTLITDRLNTRYNYSYIRKNTVVWLKKTMMRKWKEFTTNLSRLRAILRRIGMATTLFTPCFNSWRLYTHQMKELKKRLRRKLMGLKQACLNAWHEITKYLNERRLRIYDKFSRRLRHRNLLRPFLTLSTNRIQSLSSKSIQKLVRGYFDRKKVDIKRNNMITKEMERSKKEKEMITQLQNEQTKTKISSHILKESIAIVSQHLSTAMNTSSLSPRTKLLRPLLHRYDIDRLNSIEASHCMSFTKDLGLSTTIGKSIQQKTTARINEKRMKALLKTTHYDTGLVVKLRRSIRNVMGWSLQNVTKTHIRSIRLEHVKKKAQSLYRKQNGSPHISCSACGEGFVLYSNMTRHQSGCLLHRRGDKMTTPREQLTRLVNNS